jgi:hypothetical protein
MPQSENISRLARSAETIALAAIAAIILYGAYLVYDQAELRAVISVNTPGLVSTPPGWAVAVAAALLGLLALIFIAGMWEVRKLFRLLATGSLADPAFGHILRRLGWLAVSGGVASILIRTVNALLMSVANPPGQKILLIEISSGQIASLIMGLLFFMFTHVFAEVARIDEDNKSII